MSANNTRIKIPFTFNKNFISKILLFSIISISCSTPKLAINSSPSKQYVKKDYRILKKENRYTETYMIRQKSNGFFIPKEKVSIDMDIIISSLKVPYLRVSYYGNKPLNIPVGQTLIFRSNNSEIKLSSKKKSNRLSKGGEVVEVISYLITRAQIRKISEDKNVTAILNNYSFSIPLEMKKNWIKFISEHWY